MIKEEHKIICTEALKSNTDKSRASEAISKQNHKAKAPDLVDVVIASSDLIKGPQILIIEDNPALVSMLQIKFKKHKLDNVDYVDNHEKALKIPFLIKYAYIFVDYYTPGRMDGLRFIQIARTIVSKNTIFFAFSTDNECVEEMIKAGAEASIKGKTNLDRYINFILERIK